ncbi:molybdenum cofactor biosynthesis protein MoaE [Aestuariimicrobium sp. Y1814]|uniref:molybdenum cofactor biosynthesis protein MoaE n=1 Tax=Aestuariimicrobium sp. Y1814 TaxID=3418742 RepID=UPI003DA791FC
MPVVHAQVSEDAIDPEVLRRLVDSPAAGAVAVFVGQIRNHDAEATGEVESIDYSGHPDADAMIGPIVSSLLDELDPAGETLVAAQHRVGHLLVGEVAIVVAVSSGHRELAFRVCSQAVERIKAELPIWKHQKEVGGRKVWSNLGLDDTAADLSPDGGGA